MKSNLKYKTILVEENNTQTIMFDPSTNKVKIVSNGYIYVSDLELATLTPKQRKKIEDYIAESE